MSGSRDAWTKRVEEMQRKAVTRIGGGASHQAWKEREAAVWNGSTPIELPIINEGAPARKDGDRLTAAAPTPSPNRVVDTAGMSDTQKVTSKFRNIKTNGYASKKEAARAAELKLMQEAGQITSLREQVPFELIPSQDGERPCRYIADFVYEQDGQRVVEDTKGVKTEAYIVKRKLMLFRHGIRISEV